MTETLPPQHEGELTGQPDQSADARPFDGVATYNRGNWFLEQFGDESPQDTRQSPDTVSPAPGANEEAPDAAPTEPKVGRHAHTEDNPHAVSVADLLATAGGKVSTARRAAAADRPSPSPRPRPRPTPAPRQNTTETPLEQPAPQRKPSPAPGAAPETKPQPALRERIKNWTNAKKLGAVALATLAVSWGASAKHESDERAALEQRVEASSQIPDRLPKPEDGKPDRSPLMVTFNVWENEIRDTVLDERIAVPHTVGEETRAFNYLQESPKPDEPSRAGYLAATMSFTTAGNPSYDSDAERKGLADPNSFKGAEGQGLVPMTEEVRTAIAAEINKQIDEGDIDAPRIDPLRNDPRDNLVMAGRWMNKLALEAVTAKPDATPSDDEIFAHVINKMGNGEYSEAFKKNVAMLGQALNAPGQPDAAAIYDQMLHNSVLYERTVKALLAQIARDEIKLVVEESDS